MADNSKPNSLQASYAKAKAGRSCVDIALRCVALCGTRRLRRRRAAREMVARREDPRHLRGHAADPASYHRSPAARQELGRAQVAAGVRSARQPEAKEELELQDPSRRHPRRQPDPLRPLQRRLRQGVQPGHAHRCPRRPGRARQPRRQAPRRGRRGRRAQAQPRLQPDPRVRSRLEAGARDPRLRRRPGLRDRPRGGDPRREQDRARPAGVGDRRWRRYDLRRADRAQRRPARDPARAQQRPLEHRPAQGRGEASPGPDRARLPAQRRAAHRALDGRAHRDHGARSGG